MWRGAPVPGVAGVSAPALGALLAPVIRACAADHRRERRPRRMRRSPPSTSIRRGPRRSAWAWQRLFSARPKLRDARTAEALGLESPSCSGWEACDRMIRARGSTPSSWPWNGSREGARRWRSWERSGPRPTALPPTPGAGTLRLVLSGAVDDVELASLYRQAAVSRPPLDARGFRSDRAGGDGVRRAAGRDCGREPAGSRRTSPCWSRPETRQRWPRAIEAVLTGSSQGRPDAPRGMPRASGYSWGGPRR